MSFRFHFIITFIVLETLFLLGIVAINFNSLERESHQLLQDKTEIASSLFSEIVKTSLLVNDLATIDDAARQFVGMENIVLVRLYNDSGELLSSAHSEAAYTAGVLDTVLKDCLLYTSPSPRDS